MSTSRLLVRTAQLIECSLCSRPCTNDFMSMISLVRTITTEEVLSENWSMEVLSPSAQTAQLLGCRAGVWVHGISPQTRRLRHPFTLAWPLGESLHHRTGICPEWCQTCDFSLSSLPLTFLCLPSLLFSCFLQPLFLIWIHSFAYFVPLFCSDQLGQNINHCK